VTAAAVRELVLRHPTGETSIRVGQGALAGAGPPLAAWVAGRALFVVSDPRVLALHGAALAPLQEAARRTTVLEVPQGEAAKTLATAESLWSRMLEAGGKRDSRLVAFGGGSVGDLAGFAAGCFLRGIELAQLLTTLLAQADAAIGGKTAVDLAAAKNSVGVFHHPALVIADTDFLRTLPAEELRSGLVEVIKMAALIDPPLLTRVEGDLERLLAGDSRALAPVAAAGAAAKVAIVERDPDERGARRVLNFGHTLGHAIEAELGYRGLRHGEAVAYGILFALRLARRRGLADGDAERLRGLLRRLGLPPLPRLDPAGLGTRIGRDKKALETGVEWVLPAAIGEPRVASVPAAEVAAELAVFLADPFAP